ncbi:phage tail protein [Vibrio sp. HN007]|uniref:phage tail protein n=1 Tax=Vibrio iocasae TaxID=3098914 RepID=UPI0035D4E7EE
MSTQYQAGYKLRDLKAHIAACVGKHIAKGLDAEMLDVELILTPKHMGHGMNMMNQRYVAEFYFDRFPFKKYDPAVLFANVGGWLMDNDGEREENDNLDDPEIEVVIEDEDSAEIIINVHFEEPVKVVENLNGDIHWRGKRWSIEQYEIWVAENLTDVSVR